MAAKEVRALTEVQRKTLEALRDGGMITVDQHNMPWLGDRPLQPVTTRFLGDHVLITRLDKSRPVAARGNGLVITDKGRSVLADQRPTRKAKADQRPAPPTQPTESQLAYAQSLGIDVPADATSLEVSDLISLRVEEDTPASDDQQAIAESFGAPVTRFTGERQIFERIFNAVRRPTHEVDLATWFAYRVYRDLLWDAKHIPIGSPTDPAIKQIGAELAADEACLRSIRRYSADGLLRFGQWTAADGAVRTGGSKRTAGYSRAVALLKERLGVGQEARAGLAGRD